MKKLLFIVPLLAALAVYGQKPPAAKTANTLLPVKLAGRADSLQYTLGAFMGIWISNNGFTVNTSSPLFLRGLDDILQNRTRVIPDSLVPEQLTQYQEEMQKGKARQMEQLLFSTLKDKPGVGMFPNGVRYVILKTGKGARPANTDSIILHMIAKLPDGTVVEDTYQGQRPFQTRPDAFFPALTEALEMMPEGSKWQLFIPAALAYGEKGTPLIPANSALVIEVELVKVRRL